MIIRAAARLFSRTTDHYLISRQLLLACQTYPRSSSPLITPALRLLRNTIRATTGLNWQTMIWSRDALLLTWLSFLLETGVSHDYA